MTLIERDIPKAPLAPESVLMSAMLSYYMDGHGRQTRSANAAKRACALCLQYLKQALGTAASKVADFSLPRQYGFMRWCREEHGLSAKSIANYLDTINAANNYAAKPKIITDNQGREREGRLLAAPIHIEKSEKIISQITGAPRSQPRNFLPTDAELAGFLDAIADPADEEQIRDREHIFRYCIIALNTWARPEAICQINFLHQANFENDLLNLNPPGRVQNNKRRPTIRVTRNLRGWLHHWNLAQPIQYHGEPVAEISPKTFKKIATAAGVPELVRYSLRHFMNTRAMRVRSDIRPDREERAVWMGHADAKHSQTTWYERFDPEYLNRCSVATDVILIDLNRLSRRSLFAPGTAVGADLTVIENAFQLGNLGKKAEGQS